MTDRRRPSAIVRPAPCLGVARWSSRVRRYSAATNAGLDDGTDQLAPPTACLGVPAFPSDARPGQRRSPERGRWSRSLSTSKFDALVGSLRTASRFLATGLFTPESAIQRAAAIQAFAFSYELAWKLMQARLRDERVSVATPRRRFAVPAMQALWGAWSGGWTISTRATSRSTPTTRAPQRRSRASSQSEFRADVDALLAAIASRDA